jgi:hypothetical protein
VDVGTEMVDAVEVVTFQPLAVLVGVVLVVVLPGSIVTGVVGTVGVAGLGGCEIVTDLPLPAGTLTLGGRAVVGVVAVLTAVVTVGALVVGVVAGLVADVVLTG